jgi:phosphatidylethanolamine-binding protein (PEBP) family uncharacterized protein
MMKHVLLIKKQTLHTPSLTNKLFQLHYLKTFSLYYTIMFSKCGLCLYRIKGSPLSPKLAANKNLLVFIVKNYSAATRILKPASSSEHLDSAYKKAMDYLTKEVEHDSKAYDSVQPLKCPPPSYSMRPKKVSRDPSLPENDCDYPASILNYEKLVFSDPNLLYSWSQNNTELVIPLFFQMNNTEWRQNYGPILSRTMAKIDGLIAQHQPAGNNVEKSFALPYTSEARLNLSSTLKSASDNSKHLYIRRGNQILLDDADLSKPPNISFDIDKESLAASPDDRYISVLFIDLDYPNQKQGCLSNYIHWASGNIPINSLEIHNGMNQKVSVASENMSSTESQGELLVSSYVPPHPQRGTGYHRYMILVVSHPSKFSFGTSRDSDANIDFLCPVTKDSESQMGAFRYCDISSWHWKEPSNIISVPRSDQNAKSSLVPLSVLSFSWFKSCWTKRVDSITIDTSIPNSHRMVFGHMYEAQS